MFWIPGGCDSPAEAIEDSLARLRSLAEKRFIFWNGCFTMSLKFGFEDITCEVKNVNSKMKGIFILGLVVVAAVASMGFLTASAAANGDAAQTRDRAQDCVNGLVGDQARDRMQDQLQDQDYTQNCVNDCIGDQTRDRIQDQLQNQDCPQDCEQNCQQDQLQTRCRAGGC